ncbi:hypothetical protein [Candidatus Epulonipiscium viviparus]|uniref:hypothetical protein n=1 Tax=Candidatus Epulonipiscium viviparus TaxID=420336 RepID=UPI0027380C75|nr:hypothetical protein [Candidatus Epulopiscium viviparus]
MLMMMTPLMLPDDDSADAADDDDSADVANDDSDTIIHVIPEPPVIIENGNFVEPTVVIEHLNDIIADMVADSAFTVETTITSSVDTNLEGGVLLPLLDAEEIPVAEVVDANLEAGILLPLLDAEEMPVAEVVDANLEAGIMLPLLDAEEMPVAEVVDANLEAGIMLPLLDAEEMPVAEVVDANFEAGKITVTEVVDANLETEKIIVTEDVDANLDAGIMLPLLDAEEMPVAEIPVAEIPVTEGYVTEISVERTIEAPEVDVDETFECDLAANSNITISSSDAEVTECDLAANSSITISSSDAEITECDLAANSSITIPLSDAKIIECEDGDLKGGIMIALPNSEKLVELADNDTVTIQCGIIVPLADDDETVEEEIVEEPLELVDLVVKGLSAAKIDFQPGKYNYTLDIVAADADRNFIIDPILANDVDADITVTDSLGNEEPAPGAAIISTNILNNDSVISVVVGDDTYNFDIVIANNDLLDKPIKVAQENLSTTVVSKDGKLVDLGILWVTEAAKAKYELAINKALKVFTNNQQTSAQVAAALDALATASAEFDAAKQWGIKAPNFGVLNISLSGDVSYNADTKTIKMLSADASEFDVTIVASNIHTVVANSVTDDPSAGGIMTFTVPAPIAEGEGSTFSVSLSLHGSQAAPVVFTVEAYQEKIWVPDAGLRQALTENGVEFDGKWAILSTLKPLKQLIAQNYGIKNLEGLQYASNLVYLDLSRNQIEYINLLSALEHLAILNVTDNNIRSFNLDNFPSLINFSISDNHVEQ